MDMPLGTNISAEWIENSPKASRRRRSRPLRRSRFPPGAPTPRSLSLFEHGIGFLVNDESDILELVNLCCGRGAIGLHVRLALDTCAKFRNELLRVVVEEYLKPNCEYSPRKNNFRVCWGNRAIEKKTANKVCDLWNLFNVWSVLSRQHQCHSPRKHEAHLEIISALFLQIISSFRFSH